MQSTRTNQGGSVLAFIIVGTVLAFAVVGGVYLAHQRGEQQRQEQSTPVAVNEDKNRSQSTAEPQSSNSNNKTKTEENKPSASSGNPQSSTSQSQSPSQVPSASTDQGTRPNVATGPSVGNTGALPVTGPLDTVVQLVALAFLTATVVAYIQSLRCQRPSSL